MYLELGEANDIIRAIPSFQRIAQNPRVLDGDIGNAIKLLSRELDVLYDDQAQLESDLEDVEEEIGELEPLLDDLQGFAGETAADGLSEIFLRRFGIPLRDGVTFPELFEEFTEARLGAIEREKYQVKLFGDNDA